MKHSNTCTCESCLNKEKLNEMGWFVFWEHRGYMEGPKAFDSYEKALEFAKKEKSFCMPYVVFGDVYELYGSDWKFRKLKTKGDKVDKGISDEDMVLQLGLLKVGSTISFPCENEIKYYQDFTSHIGIPTNIEFTVVEVTKDTARLVADGFGKQGNYGCGAIYVYNSQTKGDKE